jgi:hypothetical protein
VDNKHNLVVATHTINRNDLNALGLSLWSKRKFGVDTFTVLVDKGYHNGREIAQCNNNNTTVPILRQEAKKVLLNPNIW